MEIIEKNGDLLEENCNIICHQVNCQGVMGSGIALQIKNKWPKVYQEYCAYLEFLKFAKIPLLGRCNIVNIKEYNDNIDFVCNFYAQYFYGTDKRHTDYVAFEKCLLFLKDTVRLDYEKEGKHCVIGFPYKIGCDRGGGDWNIIKDMILKTFNNVDCTIKIVKWNG